MTDFDFGHVKLSRKMFDAQIGDPLWLERRERTRLEAWLDLLQMACFAAYRHSTSYGVVELDRGEFVVSRRFLAERWQWTEKRVRTFIEWCRKEARIEAKRETQAGTVYLVVNYEAYQNPQRAKGPAKGQDAGHARAQQGPTEGPRDKQVKAGKAKDLTTLSDSTGESAADQLGLDVKVPSDVQVVLDHYLVTHPRRRIGPKDRKAVAKALTLGYAAGELIEAIDGNVADDWHVEKHKHELSYVLRDNGKIDDFRERAAGANGRVAVDPETGLLNEVGMAVLNGNGRHS